MPSDGRSREARIAAALAAMPPVIRRYLDDRRLTDPYGRCRCGKRSWRSEAAAAAALQLAREAGHYPDAARVYKCPAVSRWHIATRGFHPAALKSRARIIAWYLCNRGLIDLSEIAKREFHIERWSAKKYFHKDIAVMINTGLACWDQGHPGYLAAVDKAGLFRVCEIGMREYLIERYARDPRHLDLEGRSLSL
jgi:hypothetical protein